MVKARQNHVQLHNLYRRNKPPKRDWSSGNKGLLASASRFQRVSIDTVENISFETTDVGDKLYNVRGIADALIEIPGFIYPKPTGLSSSWEGMKGSCFDQFTK